jgi:hypothetical protein
MYRRFALQRAAWKTYEELTKLGFEGHGERCMVVGLPAPSEDSRLKAKLKSMMPKFETKINSGRWQCYLTPDEEKLFVNVVEQRDLHGFGFDRKQLQVIAKRWCKRLGYVEIDCGNRWFLGKKASIGRN